MNTNDLEIFETLAHTRSFTETAQQMNTVQSNVTARIRSLETTFKVRLFNRNSREVTLTPAGEKLLPYAKNIRQLLVDAAADLSNAEVIDGKLNLGATQSTAAIRLPSILAGYSRHYPKVEINLSTVTTEQLVRDVLDYKLDGAFLAGPVTEKDLVQEILIREELALASGMQIESLNHMLKTEENVKLIVFKKGCAYRFLLESFLTSRGVRNYSVMEFSSLEGIINCVKFGIGITIMPKEVLAMYKNRGDEIRMHELPRKMATAEILFIHRKDLFQSRALKYFIDGIKKKK